MADAQEVGVGGNEDNVLEESEENEWLLWDLGVLSVHSNVNYWLLVESEVVNDSPNGGKGEGDDNEDASVWELASGLHSVSGEVDNEEASGNNSWNQEDQQDSWVPPVDVLIE